MSSLIFLLVLWKSNSHSHCTNQQIGSERKSDLAKVLRGYGTEHTYFSLIAESIPVLQNLSYSKTWKLEPFKIIKLFILLKIPVPDLNSGNLLNFYKHRCIKIAETHLIMWNIRFAHSQVKGIDQCAIFISAEPDSQVQNVQHS